MQGWTNDAVIERWGAFPRAMLESMEPEGDFAKRHLLNPVLLRMLGDVRGRRVLDAGCGHGYLARMLAARGAQVTGVEPARSLYAYAAERRPGRRRASATSRPTCAGCPISASHSTRSWRAWS